MRPEKISENQNAFWYLLFGRVENKPLRKKEEKYGVNPVEPVENSPIESYKGTLINIYA